MSHTPLTYRGTIQKVPVVIHLEDITKFPADAYLVPQFPNYGSFGGVAGAIAKAGGDQGLRKYNQIAQAREQKLGSVVVTKWGAGKNTLLCNVGELDPLKADGRETKRGVGKYVLFFRRAAHH